MSKCLQNCIYHFALTKTTSSFNTSLSLDISLRVERGNEGKWVVISSEIKEVGPVAVKPIGVNKPHSFKTVLLNGSGPRSFATWKPQKPMMGLLNLWATSLGLIILSAIPFRV